MGGRHILVIDANQENLILLDIMMPVIDDLEFCRRIKSIENLKDIPVIFLTAKNHSSTIIEGFKAGGLDYFIAPVKRRLAVQEYLTLNNRFILYSYVMLPDSSIQCIPFQVQKTCGFCFIERGGFEGI